MNARSEDRIHAGLNTIALLVWVLVVLERSSWGRSRVTDYGSALGPVVLFFVIPLGFIAIWQLRRRRSAPLSAARSRLVRRLSAVFLGATWIVTWIPMIFWTALVISVASHRWPINIREGPDTGYARRQFEEHFGFAPDAAFGLHGRRGWEFGDGNTYRLKFEFRDPAIVERIVEATGLEPVPESELKASWLIESKPPGWWPAGAFSQFDQAFHHSFRARLWVDRANGSAYYRSSP
jgi:hypothetical protein